MTKLKIAQIVNIWQAVPPIGYGGTERVVHELCEGLVKKGHEVTLFATGNSKTSASLSFFFQDQLMGKNVPWSNYLYSLTHFLKAYEEILSVGNFNVIHGHYSIASDFISLAMARLLKIPSVFTLHTVLTTSDKHKDRIVLFEYLKNQNFISISNSQRTLPLNYVNTIYHGLNLDQFIFSQETQTNNLMWLGRIVPEKGIEVAIEVAKKLNKKITIASKIDKESEVNLSYYKTNIETILKQPFIEMVGEIDNMRRNMLLGQSKCVLFPIKWEEPFGLVMIESMACGTPVIAFARGAVPEVIKDGETGFIVNSSDDDIRGEWKIKKTGFEGLCEAVEKIYSMPNDEYQQMRQACRKHVEENFTVGKMVDNYERLYQEILEKK